MHDQVVVRCKDLRKTYEGKVEAVRGLDLTIYAGQCFGLLGPNGAGKTTTIEILEEMCIRDRPFVLPALSAASDPVF